MMQAEIMPEDLDCSMVSFSSSEGDTNMNVKPLFIEEKPTPPAATVERKRRLPARSVSMPRSVLRTLAQRDKSSSLVGEESSEPANVENERPKPAVVPVERARRLPGRSISMRVPRPTTPVGTRNSFGEDPQPVKEEKVRRLPARTCSMPKRTVWKDKGGQSRYVLRDEPPPSEIQQPVGLATVATEKLADALLSGGAAGLAVFDAVTATKRRLDRQFSQKCLNEEDASSQNEVNDGPDVDEGLFAQGRRGLIRRAKSLGAVRGTGAPVMPKRTESPERSGIATMAA